tara:strand:+ start:938 stop:1351 length:414 start_codon:yes stop_codon:yes gene_type:complete
MIIKEGEIKIMKEIIKISSDYFDCNLHEDTRCKSIATSRNICVLMIREFTNTLSFDLISKEFNRSYSNFITCNRKLQDEMGVDINLRRDINALRILIQKNCKSITKNIKNKTRLDIYDILKDFKLNELKELKRNILT